MSLEQALAANTEALQRLTAVLQSQQITPAADTPAATETKPASTRRKSAKETTATDAGTTTGSPEPTSTASTASAVRTIALGALNDGKLPSLNLVAGDPEGTLYFHIEHHRTVAAIPPGVTVPNIAGIVEIDGAVYTKLKADYASALVPSTGNVPAASAETPASTPVASTASAPDSSAQQPAIDGPAVMEIFKRLHARDGNDGLRKALDELGAKFGMKLTRVGELVADTSKHSVAYAHADAILNPKAAPAAGVDLF